MKIREKILNAKDFHSETFTSKAWDITAEVRSISQGERVQLVKQCTVDKEIDPEKFGSALIIATFRDPETGDLIFARSDRDVLNDKSSHAIDEALAVAMRVCGFDKDETEKNSKGTESVSSASV